MPSIEVSEETLALIKEQLGEKFEAKEINDLKDFKGEKLFIRTITMYYVGRVVKVSNKIIEMDECSWIPDTGRFHNAMKSGILNEIEPVGKVYLNADSIIDMIPWKHDLPKDQK